MAKDFHSKKNMLLLSGSKASGGLPEGTKAEFLDWAAPWLTDFFSPATLKGKPLLVVSYARPDGNSEDEVYSVVHDRFARMGIETICAPPEGISDELLARVGGIFVGGGHTYTLTEKLQKTGSMARIKKAVDEGLPYAGSSAGTLIACPSTKSGNDMAGPANDVIDTRCMWLIGAQLNCHYIDDSMQDTMHNGETRDTRLKEVTTFNPDMTVMGLYEGQALRVTGDQVELWTSPNARQAEPKAPIFRKGNIVGHVECKVGEPQDISRMFATPGKGAVLGG